MERFCSDRLTTGRKPMLRNTGQYPPIFTKLGQFLAIFLAVNLAISGVSPILPKVRAQSAQALTGMDQLLAPVALYPDALLAQVLACASSPDQLKEVQQWLRGNSALQGTDRQQAAEQAGFDASFIALVLFPDVIDLMVENLDWTNELGKAFVSDQKGVMASIQHLRAEAMKVGNLKSTPQQTVTTEAQGNQQIIIVQPANPQVVYVPQYNTQTVYTQSPPPSSGVSEGAAVATALVSFGLGVALGAVLSNNHYHYGYVGWSSWGFRWGGYAVVYRGGAWRVPAYPRYAYVRPLPAYRPPTHFPAPAYSRANVNINVNRQINVHSRTPRPASTYSPTSRAARTPGTATRQQPATAVRPAPGTARSPAAQPQVRSAERPTAQPSRGKPLPQPSTRQATPQTRQMQKGTSSSAFSGYGSQRAVGQASARGRASASKVNARRK